MASAMSRVMGGASSTMFKGMEGGEGRQRCAR